MHSTTVILMSIYQPSFTEFKGTDEEVAVHAVTVEDEFNGDRQSENLQKIADACQSVRIQMLWSIPPRATKNLNSRLRQSFFIYLC